MIEIAKQKSQALAINKISSYVLVSFILLAAILYIYYANVAVRTLTVLEKTKREVQSLSVSVSEMESKRLSMESNISEEKASNLGLVQINNPTFIVRGAKTATLSLRMN